MSLQKKKLSFWIYILVAVIVTGFAFYPSLSNGFTNWDDEVYVLNNPEIRDLSWEKVKHWFSFDTYHHGNYHPLTMVSYMLEYGSTDPDKNGVPKDASIFHLTNYLLHLLNTVLVFLFVNALIKDKISTLIVSVLFGIHPMHVESVAWISERKDVLYTAFYLGGLLTYLNYRKNDDWLQYGLMYLLVLCSLLSKSAAVVFPVTLLLIDYVQSRVFSMRLIAEKAPLFLLSFIFGVLAIKSQNETEAIASYDTFTTTQRMFFAGYGSLIYIFKAVWPFDLSAFHPYPAYQPGTQLLPWAFYILSAVSVLLFGGVLFFYNKWRWLVFGLFFYLVNIALVLQFVSVGSAIYAERYSYMPYIGLFILLAIGIGKLKEMKPELAKASYVVLAVLVSGLAFLTIQQTKTWKNSVTLWQQFNKACPESNFGYVKLAEYYQDHNQVDEAFNMFDYIVKTYPGSYKATMGRANLFARKGQYEEALKDYNTAITGRPELYEVYVNRAITYSIMKQFDKALEDYNKAIQYMPNNLQIYQNRGIAHLEVGNINEAIQDFSIVLQSQPTNIRIHFMKALAHHRSGNFDEAINEYSTVLQLSPKYGDAAHNRAICYESKGNYKPAYQDVLLAQQLGKQENQAYVAKLKKLAEQSN